MTEEILELMKNREQTILKNGKVYRTLNAEMKNTGRQAKKRRDR